MSEPERAPLSVHIPTSAPAHRLENDIRDFALQRSEVPSLRLSIFGYFHLFCACVVLFIFLDYFLRYTDRLESLYIFFSLYLFLAICFV